MPTFTSRCFFFGIDSSWKNFKNQTETCGGFNYLDRRQECLQKQVTTVTCTPESFWLLVRKQNFQNNHLIIKKKKSNGVGRRPDRVFVHLAVARAGKQWAGLFHRTNSAAFCLGLFYGANSGMSFTMGISISISTSLCPPPYTCRATTTASNPWILSSSVSSASWPSTKTKTTRASAVDLCVDSEPSQQALHPLPRSTNFLHM
jgi:hypothetical protein